MIRGANCFLDARFTCRSEIWMLIRNVQYCKSASWIRWITEEKYSSTAAYYIYIPPVTWLVCLDQATMLLNGRKRRAKRFESRNKDWGRMVSLDRLEEWHVVNVIRNPSRSESAHWLMRLNKHAAHEEHDERRTAAGGAQKAEDPRDPITPGGHRAY